MYIYGVMIVRCVCSGRQFLFSYKIEKRIFDNVSVDESEIFVNFCMKEDFRKLPQSFLLLEVGPPTKTAPPLSAGRFNNCLCVFFLFFFFFFRLFSADHSSEEKLENLVLRLDLSFLKLCRHFLMK